MWWTGGRVKSDFAVGFGYVLNEAEQEQYPAVYPYPSKKIFQVGLGGALTYFEGLGDLPGDSDQLRAFLSQKIDTPRKTRKPARPGRPIQARI